MFAPKPPKEPVPNVDIVTDQANLGLTRENLFILEALVHRKVVVNATVEDKGKKGWNAMKTVRENVVASRRQHENAWTKPLICSN